MSTDWGKYFDEPRLLVGREHELDRLRQWSLSDSRAIRIFGQYGVGKTTLAFAFSRENKAKYPAGVYHVSCASGNSAALAINGSVSDAKSPYLIILDDLQIISELGEIRGFEKVFSERKFARFICIATEKIDLGVSAGEIELQNLSRTEGIRLLEHFWDESGGSDHFESIYRTLGGNPEALAQLSAHLRNHPCTPRKIVELLSGRKYPGLIGVDGKPLTHGGIEEGKIICDVSIINNDLLSRIDKDKDLIYQISSRQFEELIAEALSRLGYQVELTPASRDGGFDMYVAKNDHLGRFLYLVECKKYAPHVKVGVKVVRQLAGVVQEKQASAGIVVTTSYFTKGASEFQENVSERMKLKDYLGVADWLSAAVTPNNSLQA